MTPARRAAVVLVLPVALGLGACAGRAAAGGDPAAPTAIAPFSEPVGIAPDLVFVTDLEGFALAPQSVGVMGDDGMSAAYVSSTGGAGTVMLSTSRAGVADVVPCTDLPDGAGAGLRCSVDRGDVQVRLEGTDVDGATLRAAAAAVRVPTPDELGPLFADVPVPQPPVERGDLPTEGDGAPLDPPAQGG